MDKAVHQSTNVRETASLLCELLTTNSKYRRTWRQHSTQARSGELSQAAVARVVTLYLWESGEREHEVDLARRLRDRISRALRGEKLTAETLTWMIAAFDMGEVDANRLWTAYAGAAMAVGGISHTMTKHRGMARRQWHRTQALFERYLIGAQGSLEQRRTMHTIVAMEDGVDKYLYNHESSVAEVDVLYGGRLGEYYEYGDGLVAHDIVLDYPLRKGQSVCIEYWTSYETSTPITEVRRPARARSENVDIAVQFSRNVLPSSIWWSVWSDHLDGDPVVEEPMQLTPSLAVRRFIPFIEFTVVGFRWLW